MVSVRLLKKNIEKHLLYSHLGETLGRCFEQASDFHPTSALGHELVLGSIESIYLSVNWEASDVLVHWTIYMIMLVKVLIGTL